MDDETTVDEELIEGEQPEEQEEVAEDQSKGEAPADEGEEPPETGEESEVVVSIGEDSEPEEDEQSQRPWVRDLRKQHRELVRKQRDLETENATLKARLQPAAPELGAKPTLAGHDYDEEKFGAALEAWHARKAEADEQQRARQRQEEQQRQQWQSRVSSIDAASKALKVRDADEAAQAFADTFSVVQQGVVLDLTEDPKDAALLRYALGKNPGIAKKLAAEQNPVRFAGAVAKILYKELSVKPRKSAPPPDRRVSSSVSGATAVDAALTRLQAEADKTGDRSKVAAYLRQQAQKRAA